jgi:hypothetical protein
LVADNETPRGRPGAGSLTAVNEPEDRDARLSAVERRVEEVVAEATAARQVAAGARVDAAAARHLAAAHDRDVADLGVKVDANRKAINALGVQTAARFDRLENEVRTGFAEIRGRLDLAAAGQQHIVDLLTRYLPEESGRR